MAGCRKICEGFRHKGRSGSRFCDKKMSRKARKGILGVPRRAERQVFVFGRFAEELPSDDSEDSDFNPSKDEENASIACSLPG